MGNKTTAESLNVNSTLHAFRQAAHWGCALFRALRIQICSPEGGCITPNQSALCCGVRAKYNRLFVTAWSDKTVASFWVLGFWEFDCKTAQKEQNWTKLLQEFYFTELWRSNWRPKQKWWAHVHHFQFLNNFSVAFLQNFHACSRLQHSTAGLVVIKKSFLFIQLKEAHKPRVWLPLNSLDPVNRLLSMDWRTKWIV